MKKNEFDNRLQNDLFPEMPASFGRKLNQTLESEGVKVKKRPTATGVFAGAVGLVAAAAVLLIVLMGVLGGGRSDRNQAASPGETAATPAATEAPMTWPWEPKIVTLSTGFEFKNEEKFQALYTNIMYSLMGRGESEPDELWLCGIKSRFVRPDTGNLTDLYLNGYYVLVQYAFGENDGPELYFLSDDFEVLWCTEGSAPGPNHAICPAEEDDYVKKYQGHFIYGTEPVIAEPGVPHVKRGALVSADPGADIEFSMLSSITEVQERLTAAGSAHIGAAREYFLVTVPAGNWDSIMENPILRFETEEGPVDLNLETDVPLVHTLTYAQLHSNGAASTPLPASDGELVQQVVEQVLAAGRTRVVDLTGRTCLTGEPDYGMLILRALQVSGVHLPKELWLCGLRGVEDENVFGQSAYVLAERTQDGDNGPDLYFYRDGVIQWMSADNEPERINVLYHNGNTIVFGKSRAYNNGAIAMRSGTLVFENGEERTFEPELPLSKVRQIETNVHFFDAAREWYLWVEPGKQEVKSLSILGEDGKTYRLNRVHVVEPQKVPAMAVESDGVVYPGTVTVLAQSLDENGVAAAGEPLIETLQGQAFEKIRIVRMRDRALPWSILTASDTVSVDQVDVYGAGDEQLQLDGANLDLSEIDALPPGEYFLCFHTTILGPYSEKTGKYTYRTDYTIYQAVLN